MQNQIFTPLAGIVHNGPIFPSAHTAAEAAIKQAASIKGAAANISNQISDLYAITYRIEGIVAGHHPEPETCSQPVAPGSLQEELLSYSEAIARICDRLMRIERVLG